MTQWCWRQSPQGFFYFLFLLYFSSFLPDLWDRITALSSQSSRASSVLPALVPHKPSTPPTHHHPLHPEARGRMWPIYSLIMQREVWRVEQQRERTFTVQYLCIHPELWTIIGPRSNPGLFRGVCMFSDCQQSFGQMWENTLLVSLAPSLPLDSLKPFLLFFKVFHSCSDPTSQTAVLYCCLSYIVLYY